MITTLDKLKVNEKGIVKYIGKRSSVRRRLIDMGIIPETIIKVKKYAPLGNPIQINLRGYNLFLGKKEAEKIVVEKC